PSVSASDMKMLATTPSFAANAPFSALWEVTRVALHCNVDVSDIDLQWRDDWRDLNVFWTSLKGHPALLGKTLPVKSDPHAWKLSLEEDSTSSGQAVILTASIHADKSKLDPPMRLELHPLKVEQSSRLLRRFGWDRFLEVRLLAVDSWQATDEQDLEAAVARWLASGPHHFIGRQWSAFYIRDRPFKLEEPQQSSHNVPVKTLFYDRVLFFAERGRDLPLTKKPRLSASAETSITPKYPRTALDRNAMLDWLLNWEANGQQSYLKLFHRIALGLSKTSPVIVLQQEQVRQQARDIKSKSGKGEAMNDGAGRISPSLMRKVRDGLGLQSIPSAIQGRLGSAKGMWVVDIKDVGGEDWIETWPLQRKWECDMAEPAHRTLEVRSWSTELTSASLNVQFLPILEDRALDPKAMREKFVQSMNTESEQQTEALKAAMQQAESFRKWIREQSPQNSYRMGGTSVPFLGGLPQGTEDIMSFLVDGGFQPTQLKFLHDLVFQKMKQKGDSTKQDLKIRIPRSTYAYILPDFWGVVKPGEVHLCFSSKFNDGSDELSDLDGLDVLVSRSPAHLPSDVQKVRATYHPELRHLRDIVIFSTKGDVPLASLLSGGDYDGDKVWICWDADIVNNFENHPLPPKPDFSPYLAKDRATLRDLQVEHGNGDYVNVMLEKAFCFNLRQKLLGSCTSYKEKLCYHCYRVCDEVAIKISWLLSELADQPKQGILFGQNDWNRFRDDVVGTRRQYPAPAYKSALQLSSMSAEPRHIIDYLMYEAKKVVDIALTDLHKFLGSCGASTIDRDVNAYWNQFEIDFGGMRLRGKPRNTWFPALRDGLRSDVEACLAEWDRAMRSGVKDYRDKVKHIHTKWKEIQPRFGVEQEGMSESAEAVEKFLMESGWTVAELSRWELLKASFAFKHYHRRRFVWQMAGRQLQAIKALSVRCDGAVSSQQQQQQQENVPILVTSNMYAALKPDNTYIKRLVAMEGGDGFIVPDVGPDVSVGLEGLPWGASQQEDD
ncbi:hypothetical protein M406DRAFT_270014, partial [Cryphonectria parasitica EP155]